MREPTKYTGVYSRISAERSFKGKPDICFDIAFKLEGKKIWEKIGWLSEGYSAKLASEIRAERVRGIRHGQELPQQKKKAPKFKEVAEKYLKWAGQNKTSSSSDEHRYKNHLAPRFDNKRLEEITPWFLEGMKSEILKSGLAPATAKHCLVLTRQIFNKAAAWGMYSGANPVKQVKMPALQNQRVRFLSYEEAEGLLEVLKGREKIHDMTLLSLHTGMRAGEIFDLQCHDLNFSHGIINIMDPKNGEARQAYMTESVRKMLLNRTADLAPDEYIFKNQSGSPYSEIPKDYRETADKLFNKGIKDPRQRVTFHTLRHTFASWLALRGESLLVIKELLGHKTLAMTMRYAHLMPDAKRKAIQGIESAFNQEKERLLAGLVAVMVPGRFGETDL